MSRGWWKDPTLDDDGDELRESALTTRIAHQWLRLTEETARNELQMAETERCLCGHVTHTVGKDYQPQTHLGLRPRFVVSARFSCWS
jgi:hypothetical protein